MGGAVDEEDIVTGEGVAEAHADGHRVEEGFAPAEHGNQRGKQAPDEHCQRFVEAKLQPHHRIGHQVGGVDDGVLRLAVAVLLPEEPADVRVEEAPAGVVRIGVSVGELVVLAVVAGPVQNRVHETEGVDGREEDSGQRKN